MIFPDVKTRVGLVLGSGLGEAMAGFPVLGERSYREMPGMPEPSVPGHAGCFRLVEVGGVPVVAAVGRTHIYEGQGMAAVTAGVSALHTQGVEIVLLTNAAGGIRRDLAPGSLMRIRDHINLQGVSPLEGGATFIDMTEAYDADLAQAMDKAAASAGVPLESGVYAAVRGPQFETPAEVRMLAALGADAVGMSTVPEVIFARSLGLRVAGLSMISNQAAGLGGGVLNHEEVIETGARAALDVVKLLREWIPAVAKGA